MNSKTTLFRIDNVFNLSNFIKYNKKQFTLLMYLFLIFFSNIALSEGTKQIMPNAANRCGLTIKNTLQLNSGNWGGYNPANNFEKIFIHIRDFSNERIYFGFQRRTNFDFLNKK